MKPSKSITIIIFSAIEMFDTVALAKSASTAFRTFANPNMGIKGLVPHGWSETRPGEFRRSPWNDDPTLLVQVGIPRLFRSYEYNL